jgi:hypothetical protein
MVQRNNNVDCCFCFHKDIHKYFSSAVSEPELDCQIGLLPAPFSKVYKLLKTISLRVDESQTRFLVTLHSIKVLKPAEKIIIRLNSTMKCSAFGNLIPFLCVKRNVSRLRPIYFEFF